MPAPRSLSAQPDVHQQDAEQRKAAVHVKPLEALMERNRSDGGGQRWTVNADDGCVHVHPR